MLVEEISLRQTNSSFLRFLSTFKKKMHCDTTSKIPLAVLTNTYSALLDDRCLAPSSRPLNPDFRSIAPQRVKLRRWARRMSRGERNSLLPRVFFPHRRQFSTSTLPLLPPPPSPWPTPELRLIEDSDWHNLENTIWGFLSPRGYLQHGVPDFVRVKAMFQLGRLEAANSFMFVL